MSHNKAYVKEMQTKVQTEIAKYSEKHKQDLNDYEDIMNDQENEIRSKSKTITLHENKIE